MKATIRAAAGVAPLVVLSGRAYLHPVLDLGSDKRAQRFLLRQAERTENPISLTLEFADGESRSYFVAPRGWTDERLRGWTARHRVALEPELGDVARVTTWEEERGHA